MAGLARSFGDSRCVQRQPLTVSLATDAYVPGAAYLSSFPVLHGVTGIG